MNHTVDKLYNYIDYILPLYFIISLPELYYGAWGIFVITKYFSFVLLVLLSARVYEHSKKSKIFGLFTFYFLYCIFSFCWYSVNDVSIKCYMNEVFNSLPAMFFVYIGMAEKRRDNRFYKLFLWFCTVSMFIGIFLYLTTPGWYISRKTELYNNQWYNSGLVYQENDYLESMRFSSYLGSSYNVDFFALLAMSISLFTIYYAYKNKKHTLFVYFCFLINFIAAFLSQMRVAMVYSVCTILLFLYYGTKYNNKKASFNLLSFLAVGLILIVTIGFVIFGERGDVVQSLLLDRIDNLSFSDAVAERSYQLDLLTKHWHMPLFGHGIGSGGSVARSMGYPGVSDSSYIELLYEIGIVGFLLFLIIMFKTIRRAYRYRKYYTIELVFIGFVLCACIGSNTLSMSFVCVFPFWYCIGRVWNESYLKHAKKNNISI